MHPFILFLLYVAAPEITLKWLNKPVFYISVFLRCILFHNIINHMWKKKYSPQIKFSKQNIGKLHMTEKVIYWPFHSSGFHLSFFSSNIHVYAIYMFTNRRHLHNIFITGSFRNVPRYKMLVISSIKINLIEIRC